MLSAKSCFVICKVKYLQMSEHRQSINELWQATCFWLISSVLFCSTAEHRSWKRTGPNMYDAIQTWLIYLFIYLLLLSRGIHYSANHSLANVQYKCHDRYYYIHIDHWWRDSVGKACSVLRSNALHWVCRVEIKREGPMMKIKLNQYNS